MLASVDIYRLLNLESWSLALRMFHDKLLQVGFMEDQANALCLSLFTAAANAQTSFNMNVQGK